MDSKVQKLESEIRSLQARLEEEQITNRNKCEGLQSESLKVKGDLVCVESKRRDEKYFLRYGQHIKLLKESLALSCRYRSWHDFSRQLDAESYWRRQEKLVGEGPHAVKLREGVRALGLSARDWSIIREIAADRNSFAHPHIELTRKRFRRDLDYLTDGNQTLFSEAEVDVLIDVLRINGRKIPRHI